MPASTGCCYIFLRTFCIIYPTHFTMFQPKCMQQFSRFRIWIACELQIVYSPKEYDRYCSNSLNGTVCDYINQPFVFLVPISYTRWKLSKPSPLDKMFKVRLCWMIVALFNSWLKKSILTIAELDMPLLEIGHSHIKSCLCGSLSAYHLIKLGCHLEKLFPSTYSHCLYHECHLNFFLSH